MAKRPTEYGARVSGIFEQLTKHDIFTAWLEDLVTRGEEHDLTGEQAAAYIAERASMVRDARRARA